MPAPAVKPLCWRRTRRGNPRKPSPPSSNATALPSCGSATGSWATGTTPKTSASWCSSPCLSTSCASNPRSPAACTPTPPIVLLPSGTRPPRHEQQAAKPVQVASEEPAHDQREELDAALARIPGPLREAVRLRYLEGLSQLEAAHLVGCPRGTLAQRAAHGVARLRGILSNGHDIPEAK